MSASIRSTNSLNSSKQDFLAHLREATATPGPATAILEDPSLMRALAQSPRSRASSSKKAPSAGAPSSAPDPLLLSLVLAAEDRQGSRLRGLLCAAADQLEHEMRRAEAAEQRVEYVEAQMRHVARLGQAQREAEETALRAVEEAKRYRALFEGAQAELVRAEEEMEELEAARVRAEEGTRRAKDVARQYEKAMAEREAREAGWQEGVRQMKQGFAEGVEAGRREGYDFAKKAERARRKKIRDEAFEAGRTEGYDEGNMEGRALERKNAMESFDRFLEREGYVRDEASSSSNSSHENSET